MLIAIDESGDPGFTIGCSEFFIMGMVIFDKHANAEKISSIIDEVRHLAKIKGEFKFTKTSNMVKKLFFESIAKQKFKIRVYVADKANVKAKEIRTNPSEFYRFCLAKLITSTGNLPDGFTIKIDKCGNKIFRNSCASYLRQSLPAGKMAALKMVDSKKDNLVQLADMVTGAIARKYGDKTNNDIWYNNIRHLIDCEALNE